MLKKHLKKVFYHEDMYLQVEILPKENLAFCNNQINSIIDFSNDHRDGFGFTDMFVPENESIKLESKNIQYDAIKDILSSHMDFYKDVYTGYGSYEVKCSNTVGFGFDTLQILVNFNDKNTIKNIWINGFTESIKEVECFAKSLIELGINYDLIICDWESTSLIDLKEKDQVEEYATSYYIG